MTWSLHSAARVTALAMVLVLAHPSRAEQIVETDDDGKVVLKYTVDDDGLPHGAYFTFHANGKVKTRTMFKHGARDGDHVEYHENGKVHAKGRYRDGKLDGPYEERDPLGQDTLRATYAMGVVDGELTRLADGRIIERQVWQDGGIVSIDGFTLHPRTRDEIALEIEEAFASSDPLETAAGDKLAGERGEALRHLKAYRAVVGVPWRDLHLDAKMNAFADGGAALCERIGRLDHTPENPGMPEDEYKFGYTGTSNSNLYVGSPEHPMIVSVRGYMDDSDPTNIERVGHRRWCINPPMLKTGFGESGKYSAMWSMDASGKGVKGYDVVSYPPCGYVPTEYFAASYAWSVSFRDAGYAPPKDGTLSVEVVAMDADWKPSGTPLGLEAVTVAKGGVGDRFCVIFRPRDLVVEDGARYRARISGLTRKGDPYTHLTFVEFFDLL